MSALSPHYPTLRTLVGVAGRSLVCRYCCKSILSILSRNIDSRSGANAQQRFKEAHAPIRSLQISISRSLLGDFCNTICQERTQYSLDGSEIITKSQLGLLTFEIRKVERSPLIDGFAGDLNVPGRRYPGSFGKSCVKGWPDKQGVPHECIQARPS
jgi:hypothetical protein